MNVPYFSGYVQNFEKINKAFAYLPDFNIKGVLAAWEQGGLFSPDLELSRWWINVAAHMSVSAVLGFVLAEIWVDSLKKDNVTVCDVVEALLVHDWNKRKEEHIRVTKGDAEQVSRFNIRDNRKLLRWFPKTVAKLVMVTGGTGLAINERRGFTLAEKIVFYSDCCTFGSTVTTHRKRLDALLPHFRPGGRYERENQYYQERYGMSHLEKNDQLLLPIESQFAARYGLDASQGELPLHLVPKIFLE